MTDARDLGLMLDSKVPLVVVETFEEKRALDLLLKVARQEGRELYRWSCTDGLTQMSFGPQLAGSGKHPEAEKVLEQIKGANQAGIYVLCDLHPFLNDDPKLIRLLKDIAINHHVVPHTLVLLSHALTLPPELSRYSARFRLSLPGEEELLALIREEAQKWSERNGGARIKTDNRTLKALVNNLKGVTFADARRLIRGAIVDDGAITDSDLPDVNKAKFALMDMEGVLSFEYHTEQFAQVGGLHRFKAWIQQRRAAFMGDNGLETPKGVLLLGVQGGGKSLAAKAVAGLWQVPLLRLDFGALYNKFFGETERNLREALKLAEVMAPCVLWLDEIEKGIGTDGSDSGTSKRVLGTLLTWLADRQQPVFIVATANDIRQLPPELIRKGRLDEIFFVDLPDAKAREQIFAIHLDKRGQRPAQFDLGQLAEASAGFTGAEIEQAVVSALYRQSDGGQDLDEAAVLAEIRGTSPLSVVRAEDIAALRQWAAERAVPAD